MKVVLGLAAAAIVMLGLAVLTGNAIVALVVVALAALGLFLLARDWRRERVSVDAKSGGPDNRGPDPETFQPDPWDEEAGEAGADADYPDDE